MWYENNNNNNHSSDLVAVIKFGMYFVQFVHFSTIFGCGNCLIVLFGIISLIIGYFGIIMINDIIME